jgi:hypothetical protein
LQVQGYGCIARQQWDRDDRQRLLQGDWPHFHLMAPPGPADEDEVRNGRQRLRRGEARADAQEVDLHQMSGAGEDLQALAGVFLPARPAFVGRRQDFDARYQPALGHVADLDTDVGNRFRGEHDPPRAEGHVLRPQFGRELARNLGTQVGVDGGPQVTLEIRVHAGE